MKVRGSPASTSAQSLRCRALVALAAALGVLCSAGACRAEAPGLAERLDRVIARSAALRAARVGAVVVRVSDGRVLYAREPDRPLIPASNMKVLTAVAALDAFGPSHHFETVIRADRPPDGDGAVGTLAVQGGGDPVVNSEDWWRLASELRREGVRRVEGDILVDDSIFDTEYWHPDWGRVSSRAYHAPVSGLTANYGAFFVRVQPGAVKGAPVRVFVDPPVDYLRVTSSATTGGKRSKRSLSVGRGKAVGAKGQASAHEVVHVSGQVRAGDGADLVPRSVRDSTLYAGAVFAMQLEAVGIEVGGQTRRGDATTLPRELLRFEGRPVSEIVRLFMKYSNNSIAESLVKLMGAHASGGPGSWDNGLAEMHRRLEALRLSAEGLHFVDGSGLSPANRVPPRLLCKALLQAHRAFGFGPELIAALPIARRDGTLEKRATRSRDKLRAKTGLLSDQRTTALSGYALLAGDELGVFAVVVNGYAGHAQGAMDAVDLWVAELAR